MPRRYINQLADGESVDDIYLVVDKQIRLNRNAAPYLLLEVRDRTAAVSARLWNCDENQSAHIKAGDYVRLRGKAQLYQGALQILLSGVQAVAADTIDPAEYERLSQVDIPALTAELQACVNRITSVPVRTLLQLFLDDPEFMASFTTSPAGLKAHHCYKGGLLEHVVNMLHIAERIDDLLTGVDPSLLRAGILLHDMGKIREMSLDAGVYTDEGQLLGHLVIAVEMLSGKAAAYAAQTGSPFPTEELLRLKHLIVSHHGSYEFGSPRLPMTPEAVALHHIDNLDAKVHEFSRDIADDPNRQSSWTPYNSRLERKLFKGLRSVSTPASGHSGSNAETPEPAPVSGQ
jgi:3'-5' exoribonuclease